jgi:hypothetical protein
LPRQKPVVELQKHVLRISLIIHHIQEGGFIVLLHDHLDIGGASMGIICTAHTTTIPKVLDKFKKSLIIST